MRVWNLRSASDQSNRLAASSGLPVTQPSATADTQSAIEAFRQVCSEFLDLSNSEQGGSVLFWSGYWHTVTYLLRHPIKGYFDWFRGLRTPSRLGSLAPSFPLDAMVASLCRYSEPQLKAIKSLSEVELRRVKSIVTDHPALKFAGGFGSLYALLEVSNKLVTASGSPLDFVRAIIASSNAQLFMGAILAGFIGSLVVFAVQYLFSTQKLIARAHLLDDVLLVAIEQKRLMDSFTSNHTSLRQADAPQATKLKA